MNRKDAIVKRRLSEWIELSEEWLLLIDRFCRIMPNDAPYFYGEEANTGILAGAAWRCGWIALQEFKQTKKRGNIDWEGMQDLLIHSGKKLYGIETKQSWPDLANNTALKTIRDCMEESYKDAETLDSAKYDARIGLSFHVPSVHIKHQEETDKLIDNLLIKLDTLQCDLIICSFPEITRNLIERKENKRYPGIIITANVIS